MLLVVLVRDLAKGSRIVEITDIESNVFPDYNLSILTILLPLYKEKNPIITLKVHYSQTVLKVN